MRTTAAREMESEHMDDRRRAWRPLRPAASRRRRRGYRDRTGFDWLAILPLLLLAAMCALQYVQGHW
jgi:hypothetical protein